MKKIIIIVVALFCIFKIYANEKLFHVTLEIDKDELFFNQTVRLTLKIKNLQNYSQRIRSTSIYTAMSYLRFSVYEDGVLKELPICINSTISKRIGELIIEPQSEVILMQEVELSNERYFDLKTLTEYSGYALVLKDEGVFLPIEKRNEEIFISGRLQYDGLLFESGNEVLNVIF